LGKSLKLIYRSAKQPQVGFALTSAWLLKRITLAAYKTNILNITRRIAMTCLLNEEMFRRTIAEISAAHEKRLVTGLLETFRHGMAQPIQRNQN